MGRRRKPPRLEQIKDWFYIKHFNGTSGRTERFAVGTKDAQQAQAALEAFVTETEQFTVERVLAMYDQQHERSDVCKATDATDMRALCETVGDVLVEEWTNAVTAHYIDARRAAPMKRNRPGPRKMSTIRKELETLRRAVNWAKRRGIIKRAPTLELPHVDTRQHGYVDEETHARILAYLDQTRRGTRLSNLERWYWMAYLTGQRRHTICSLTWDRVDFEARTINFVAPWHDPRSAKKKLLLPMSDKLAQVVERAREEAIDGFYLDWGGKHWQIRHDASCDQRNVARSGWTRMRAKLGLTGLRMHDLRATFLTRAAHSGVGLAAVSQLGGLTMRTAERYMRTDMDALRRAMDRVHANE